MLTKAEIAFVLQLKPEEMIAYLKNKGYAITFNWDDIPGYAHTTAFTVAKAMKTDLLEDIRKGLLDAIGKGQTLKEFTATLQPLLIRKGWWGRKPINEVPGLEDIPEDLTDKSKVQLGSPHRLATIYYTNMSTSYAKGRLDQQVANAPKRPYWLYEAVMDRRTRPSHAKLNGEIRLWNDPFWNTHYPPNDWGCRCMVRALTEAEFKERGGVLTTGPATLATGKGWDHKPGALA